MTAVSTAREVCYRVQRSLLQCSTAKVERLQSLELNLQILKNGRLPYVFSGNETEGRKKYLLIHAVLSSAARRNRIRKLSKSQPRFLSNSRFQRHSTVWSRSILEGQAMQAFTSNPRRFLIGTNRNSIQDVPIRVLYTIIYRIQDHHETFPTVYLTFSFSKLKIRHDKNHDYRFLDQSFSTTTAL